MHGDIIIFCKNCSGHLFSVTAQEQQLNWCMEAYNRYVIIQGMRVQKATRFVLQQRE